VAKTLIPNRQAERGMTIIETTVILSVMFILAGAMSPIVSESVNTARAVKAKNDASMIAMGLINFQKDLGANVLHVAQLDEILPDVLATDGTTPSVDGADDGELIESVAADAGEGLLTSPGQLRRRQTRQGELRTQRRRWREVSTGVLDDHLTTNRHGYRERRPGDNAGWAGPYLSTVIKGDPWGNQYVVNTAWLDGSSTPSDANGRTRRAVYVVSAGANGTIDTPYEQPVTDAAPVGDDVVIRIQ
jgi:type II secretory pathway pseudopilin PulG